MHIERVGFLGYKLYSLGWQSALHCDRPSIDHWLLSIFFYYRRGFSEGSNWVQEDCMEKNLH